MKLIGRGPTSTKWHIVRAPFSNEGGPDMDRETHMMSLCSHVWEIAETRLGAPTCGHCLKQLDILEGRRRSDSGHRSRQAAAVLELK